MGYIRGEEKITKTIESPEVAKAYSIIHEMMAPKLPWGSTRFSSHGYVCVCVKGKLNVKLWRVQRACPGLEFKFRVSNDKFCVMFRTKGSTGWHKEV